VAEPGLKFGWVDRFKAAVTGGPTEAERKAQAEQAAQEKKAGEEFAKQAVESVRILNRYHDAVDDGRITEQQFQEVQGALKTLQEYGSRPKKGRFHDSGAFESLQKIGGELGQLAIGLDAWIKKYPRTDFARASQNVLLNLANTNDALHPSALPNYLDYRSASGHGNYTGKLPDPTAPVIPSAPPAGMVHSSGSVGPTVATPATASEARLTEAARRDPRAVAEALHTTWLSPEEPAAPVVPDGRFATDAERTMGLETQHEINQLVTELLENKLNSERLRGGEKSTKISEYLDKLDVDFTVSASGELETIALKKGQIAAKEASRTAMKVLGSAGVSALAGMGIGLLTGGISWGVMAAGIGASSLVRLGVGAWRLRDKLREGGYERTLRMNAAKAEVERGMKAISMAKEVQALQVDFAAYPEKYAAYLAKAQELIEHVGHAENRENSSGYRGAEVEKLAKYEEKANKVEEWLAIAAGLAGGIGEAYREASSALAGKAAEQAIVQQKIEAVKHTGTTIKGHIGIEAAKHIGTTTKGQISKQVIDRHIEFIGNNWHAILTNDEVRKGATEAIKHGYGFHQISKAGIESVINNGAVNPIHAGKLSTEFVMAELTKRFGAEAAKEAAKNVAKETARLGAQAIAQVGTGWLFGHFTGRAVTNAEWKKSKPKDSDIQGIGRIANPLPPTLSARIQAERNRVAPPAPISTASAAAAPSPEATPPTPEPETAPTFTSGDYFNRTGLKLADDENELYRIIGIDGDNVEVELYAKLGDDRSTSTKTFTKTELAAALKTPAGEASKLNVHEPLPSEKKFIETYGKRLLKNIDDALAVDKDVQLQFNDTIQPAIIPGINPPLENGATYQVLAVNKDQLKPTIAVEYTAGGMRHIRELRMDPLLRYLKSEIKTTGGETKSSTGTAPEKEKSLDDKVAETIRDRYGNDPTIGRPSGNKIMRGQAYLISGELYMVSKLDKEDIELQRIQDDGTHADVPARGGKGNKFIATPGKTPITRTKLELAEQYDRYSGSE